MPKAFKYERNVGTENSLELQWAEIRRIADFRPTDHLLDVGCAEGWIALEAAGLVEHVHGFDIAGDRIAEALRLTAERGITNATFEVASLATFSLEPRSFDVVLFLAVWGKPARETSADARATGKRAREGKTVAAEELEHLLKATRRQLIMRVGVQRDAEFEPRLGVILDVCGRCGFDALCFSRPLHRGTFVRGNLIVANRRGAGARAGDLPPLALVPTSLLADHPVITSSSRPQLSVVVTLFNEAASLGELYRRTTDALAGRDYELLFVDDGSTDGTFAELERLHAADERVRVIRFKRNFGQHPAMHAGLSRARGDVIVTMDGDLQNQPEDIPSLVAAVERGSDVASGRRAARRDSWGRTLPSRVINGMLRRFTRVDISDFGCAFNAYRRSAVEPVLGSIGKQKFTKALVLSAGASVVEVDIGHAPRAGASRYSPLRLVRTALHVLAGFWPQPIQWIGVGMGALCTLAAAALGGYGIAYWVDEGDFPGPLFGGAGIVLVLGVQGFILALVGEYLGRIQRDVEGRPLYAIEREL
jgi:undecaprenyl-phosphate 4-deoxy-4-formamido-L-arabinose transferase